MQKKNDTSNNRGIWNHLKIIRTVPERHTGKTLNQRSIINSHTGHCAHYYKSTNVKVQNAHHEKRHYVCHTL